jgi:chromosome segregation ATPase
MPTLEARVSSLEALACQTITCQQANAVRLDHLSSAIAELSQQGRSVVLDIKEIRVDLGSVNSRLAGVEARTGAVETRLERVENRLGTLETRMERTEGKADRLDQQVRLGFAAVLARLDDLGPVAQAA